MLLFPSLPPPLALLCAHCAEGMIDVLAANASAGDGDDAPTDAAAGPRGISGDGVLALLRAWGAPAAAAGSGGGGEKGDFDGWRAVADQLVSSRALSCSNLKNVLEGKVACLLGE